MSLVEVPGDDGGGSDESSQITDVNPPLLAVFLGSHAQRSIQTPTERDQAMCESFDNMLESSFEHLDIFPIPSIT